MSPAAFPETATNGPTARPEEGARKATRKPFTLCVFCGSSSGNSPQFETAAEDLAKVMHAQGWSLVYGGGSRGLMGSLARSLVQLSGPRSVHGVIPRALITTERGVDRPLEQEYGHTTLVSTMHERKAIMAKEADAFVALPGGYGTMEELFEAITWSQLGIHGRPVVLYNIRGFFDDLQRWVRTSAEVGFVSSPHLALFNVANTMQELIEMVQLAPAAGRYSLCWSDHKL
ncbi:hypothetical protein EJ05DRAFT_512175 [Pseudovirgaria hyperparasitica]|uniref:Cytokinin riboside 5'-monophosphate phosphoribohydrolase n=1 Tax=Pseudovirgaria hyperparasitica TaxID=470096 RepID=A0A6A6W3D2_9PEZI|nr:uncharacterized protein EJ05DRAFT_512175 [Pseudovirgaria hyperparasitica]KAF2756524.1 hypothetical protein EJ05DRAFT_512175 [Pseudovirgaria hyperparasitica]